MSVTLVPMTQVDFDAYLTGAVRDYAQSFVDAAIMSPQVANRRAETDFEQLLSGGLQTSGEYLYTAYDGDEPVGILWLHIPDGPPDPDDFRAVPGAAFVYDVSVHADKRRRGFGRQIMQAGMDECRRRGADSLRLNVFGHNDGAKALYEQLGFKVTSTQMQLPL